MHPSLLEQACAVVEGMGRMDTLMSDSEGAGFPGHFSEPMTVLPGLKANFVMLIGDGDEDSDAEDDRVELSKHSFVYGQGSQRNGMNENVENCQDHSEVADIGARFKVIDGNVKNVIASMAKKGKKRGIQRWSESYNWMQLCFVLFMSSHACGIDYHVMSCGGSAAECRNALLCISHTETFGVMFPPIRFRKSLGCIW